MISQLPLTVIGGYLGAGKTTLINRLLADPRGKRIMVLVNDFGSINIDANLLQSANEDTIALTNGCVCCTLGNDLFMAIGDALKRTPRPDHLIVEARGIANPQKIASVAIAEPELEYQGIVTVVDAENIQNLLADQLIGHQVVGQIFCADLLAVSKRTSASSRLEQRLLNISPDALILSADSDEMFDLILSDVRPREIGEADSRHPKYVHWNFRGDREFSRENVKALLKNRPKGLYRAKGVLRTGDGTGWEVHIVGSSATVSRVDSCSETKFVCIGLAARLSETDCNSWWERKLSLA